MEFTGCKPPKRDLRDYKVCASSAIPSLLLPKSFELNKVTKVKDQGNISSCVAHAVSTIAEYYDNGKHKLSTNFIYGIQQELLGRDGKGMYLADGCQILKKCGDMLEADCPYNWEVPKCYTIAESAYKDSAKREKAYKYRIDSYYSCDSYEDIKYAIMTYGPVLASIRMYSKYTWKDNEVIVPDTKSNLGYHAVVLYGWDERGFKVQNSWGSSWGNKGYFIVTYESNMIAEAKVMVDHVDPGDPALKQTKLTALQNVFYKIGNWILNTFNIQTKILGK